jgi:alpha-ribazole phosphatase
MIIYLVRHARPHGVEGLCYGRRDVTVHASETVRAARALRRHIPEGILNTTPIYSSPLERCATLAREIAAGRVVTLTPALLELDFGAWQGQSWDAIPREELDAWAADLWGYAPGQGESTAAAARRWRSWVDSLLEQSLDAVIAVTHAGLIRVAHAIEFSSDPIRLTMEVGYGSVHRIDAHSARVSAAALEP